MKKHKNIVWLRYDYFYHNQYILRLVKRYMGEYLKTKYKEGLL